MPMNQMNLIPKGVKYAHKRHSNPAKFMEFQ